MKLVVPKMAAAPSAWITQEHPNHKTSTDHKKQKRLGLGLELGLELELGL